MNKGYRLVSLLCLAGGLFGCSGLPSMSLSKPTIVAGKSVRTDVEAAYGKPAEEMDGRAGEKVLFYTHAPNGGRTEAITLAADGTVKTVEQRLTRENVAQVTCKS